MFFWSPQSYLYSNDMTKIIIIKKTFLAILVANRKWKLWGTEDDTLMIV